VMDAIWEEGMTEYHATVLLAKYGRNYPIFQAFISEEDARAEGEYNPEQFERVFKELNPKWDGWRRWAYAFHAIEVQK